MNSDVVDIEEQVHLLRTGIHGGHRKGEGLLSIRDLDLESEEGLPYPRIDEDIVHHTTKVPF